MDKNDSAKPPKKRSIKIDPLKLTPLLVSLIFVILCAIFAMKWDFEDILAYTPHNYFLAAVVLWAFYALKSLSIVFPATVFFVVAGHIYPYWVAVIINIIGLAVSFALPYYIGRYSGSQLVEALTERYPKAKKLINYGQENNFFTVYASRAVTVVPNDLVSMLHGAVEMPFPSFIIGSLVGILPEMLVETYIGGKLSSFSVKSVLVMIGLIALTAVLSFRLNKRISRRFMKHREREAAQEN